MANRNERIQTVIARNLMEIIQFKVKNPKLGFVSIPEVKVAKDYSFARVYVSFIKKEDQEPGMEVLNHSKGFIRSELAKTLDLRKVPQIAFELDTSYDDQARLNELLSK